MSGLFGGFLTLVDVIGGAVCVAVLYVLIGEKGKTLASRKHRLKVGSTIIGLIVGVCAFALLPTDLFGPADIRVFMCFLISPLVFFGATFILEKIRKDFDDDH